MSKKTATPNKHDTLVLKATQRLNCLAEIIDRMENRQQSPGDAFDCAYRLHTEESDSGEENDFCFDELPEILLPALREARERYANKVAELLRPVSERLAMALRSGRVK